MDFYALNIWSHETIFSYAENQFYSFDEDFDVRVFDSWWDFVIIITWNENQVYGRRETNNLLWDLNHKYKYPNVLISIEISIQTSDIVHKKCPILTSVLSVFCFFSCDTSEFRNVHLFSSSSPSMHKLIGFQLFSVSSPRTEELWSIRKSHS